MAPNFLQTVKDLKPPTAVATPPVRPVIASVNAKRNLQQELSSYSLQIFPNRVVYALQKAGFGSLHDIFTCKPHELQKLRHVGPGIEDELTRAKLLVKLEDWSKKLDYGTSFNSIKLMQEVENSPVISVKETETGGEKKFSPVFTARLASQLYSLGYKTVKSVVNLSDEALANLPKIGESHLQEMKSLKKLLKRPNSSTTTKTAMQSQPVLHPAPVRPTVIAKEEKKNHFPAPAQSETGRMIARRPMPNKRKSIPTWDTLLDQPEELKEALDNLEEAFKVSPWRECIRAGRTLLALGNERMPFFFGSGLCQSLIKLGYTTVEEVLRVDAEQLCSQLKASKVTAVALARGRFIYNLDKASLDADYGTSDRSLALIQAAERSVLRIYSHYPLKEGFYPVYSSLLCSKLEQQGFNNVKQVLKMPLYHFVGLSRTSIKRTCFGGQSILELAYIKSLLHRSAKKDVVGNDVATISANAIAKIMELEKMRESASEDESPHLPTIGKVRPAVPLEPAKLDENDEEQEIPLEDLARIPTPAPAPAPAPVSASPAQPSAVKSSRASTEEGGLFAFKIRHEDEIKSLLRAGPLALRELFKRLKQQDAKEVSLTLIKLCMLQEIKIKKAKVSLEN